MSDIDFFGHKLPALIQDAETEKALIADQKAYIKNVPVYLVRVTGPDAADYLNRRACQKIVDMKTKEIRRAMILNGVGKIEQDFDIICEKETEQFLLVSTPHKGEQLAAEIDKYLFAEDCQIEDLGLQQAELLWIEPSLEKEFSADVFYRSDLFGTFLLCHVASEQRPAHENLTEIGIQSILDQSIEHGHLYFGLDFSGDHNPLELNLERALHFDKGCYPGQETIATISNLGHPSKKFVIVDSESKMEVGELKTEEEKIAGNLVRLNSSRNRGIAWVKWSFREKGTQLVSKSHTTCVVTRECEKIEVSKS